MPLALRSALAAAWASLALGCVVVSHRPADRTPPAVASALKAPATAPPTAASTSPKPAAAAAERPAPSPAPPAEPATEPPEGVAPEPAPSAAPAQPDLFPL